MNLQVVLWAQPMRRQGARAHDAPHPVALTGDFPRALSIVPWPRGAATSCAATRSRPRRIGRPARPSPRTSTRRSQPVAQSSWSGVRASPASCVSRSAPSPPTRAPSQLTPASVAVSSSPQTRSSPSKCRHHLQVPVACGARLQNGEVRPGCPADLALHRRKSIGRIVACLLALRKTVDPEHRLDEKGFAVFWPDVIRELTQAHPVLHSIRWRVGRSCLPCLLRRPCRNQDVTVRQTGAHGCRNSRGYKL